ncbi:hypothetical protein GCM10007888_17870 [Methylobacterium oxalidis]|uniref:Uncharacterized protein n=1 Tax=Methylobacterium oxalidis TaxID=944322 RepID=A0ABQ6DH16_9HYPH|nr:hypothetical protein GCM10007888_17870 [Methylobacterium oxalidis]
MPPANVPLRLPPAPTFRVSEAPAEPVRLPTPEKLPVNLLASIVPVSEPVSSNVAPLALRRTMPSPSAALASTTARVGRRASGRILKVSTATVMTSLLAAEPWIVKVLKAATSPNVWRTAPSWPFV